jgi:hypothetical protein
MSKGLRKQLEKYLAARFEAHLVTTGLLLYDLSMVQTLQTLDECEAWAEALHRIANAVSKDYGRGTIR